MTTIVLLIRSFCAGLASFESPCVWILIPGFLSLAFTASFRSIRGAERIGAHWKMVLQAVAFVIGFSLVFSLLGACGSGFGNPVSRYLPLIRKTGGLLTILFSLVLVLSPSEPRRLGSRAYQWLLDPTTIFALIGAAFAGSWIPCVGSVLASVLNMASDPETRLLGMALLFAYGVGLGIPFIIAAYAISRVSVLCHRYPWFVRGVEVAAAILLAIFGGLMFDNRMAILLRYFTGAP